MADLEKLVDDLERSFPSPHLLDETGLLHAADALLAAGWRHLPLDGPEFEAAVERAAFAITAGDETTDADRENAAYALAAALTGDRAHG